jgi:hypothetical protein
VTDVNQRTSAPSVTDRRSTDMNRNDLGTQFEITPQDRDIIADVLADWA